MLIREDVVTSATPERAWELIRDPAVHGLWNQHIVGTEIFGSGTPEIGLRYRVTYELSGRRNELDAQITEFMPGERWVARLEERLKGDGRNFERNMVESYVLTRSGGKTHVRHEVHIHHDGVHPLLKALIWFVMKFGRPVGQPMMDKFRELAEDKTRAVA